MEVETLKAAKASLEKEITKLVKDFEARVGEKINSIDYVNVFIDEPQPPVRGSYLDRRVLVTVKL